jgi:hypothetical protein
MSLQVGARKPPSARQSMPAFRPAKGRTRIIKEVTSHDRRSPNERGPSLSGTSVWTFSTQVFLTVRGEADAELEFQFVSDPFTRPRSDCRGPSRESIRAGSLAVAAGLTVENSISRTSGTRCDAIKECLRLDNDQSFTPMKEPGEQDHERACGGRTSRLLHPQKQSELFGKEQANQQEQATFHRSLRDRLRPSERSDPLSCVGQRITTIATIQTKNGHSPICIARRHDKSYSAAEVSVIPITSPGINISTRRFRSRPAAVALGAAGLVLPKPAAVTLEGGTP